MKCVDHQLAVIGDDPLAERQAIDGERTAAVFLPQAFLDVVHDGLELRLAACGADEEEIRERGNAAQIENDDVFRLLLGDEAGTELNEFFGVDGQWSVGVR